uniref:Uncharacterized protein n=1 Tax=Glossina austeni TaxID=7395 RepID=A0A1A9UQK0_GLOAU
MFDTFVALAIHGRARTKFCERYVGFLSDLPQCSLNIKLYCQLICKRKRYKVTGRVNVVNNECEATSALRSEGEESNKMSCAAKIAASSSFFRAKDFSVVIIIKSVVVAFCVRKVVL